MALDINSPVDSVQIADLPRYIRETRAAITTTGVYGASFETGVLTGDAVYLDSVNNVWRRSLAGDPTRGKFHGFADIDQGLVVIWGFFTSQAWAFADGATIYVSGSDLGALTDIDTGIAVGVCIAGDTILIDSQISSSFTALRDEIAAARDGAVDLHTKLETMDAARGVVADEITAARGGAATLANRLSLIDSSVGTVTEEVEVSRGAAATLGQRLDVSLNPDGSLKTTTSVSNFATESAAILYVNSTTFTVAGNKTAIYVANRTIRCNSSPALIGYVSSSSYAAGTGLTTVVVTGVTVPVSLSTIEYSFHPNEMPRMAHSGLTGILGADPSSSDVTTNKHVSNNQLKVLTDGKQPLDATLTALAGLTTTADKIILASGTDTFSMVDFKAVAQSIGGAADAAAVRSILSLGDAALKNVGTGSGDVSAGNHAHSGVYQPLDTELTALAGLVSAANKAPYFTGSGVAALMDVSAFARTILDDSDAATTLSTLGVTAFAKTLLDDASASDARTTLGLGSALPIGSIYLARDGDLVSGVLECAGAAVSRTTYRDLFYGSGVFPFDLTSAVFLDEKGSITTFTVDTANASGHFNAAKPARVVAGCRIVINGTSYPITSISGDGTAADSVVFAGTLAAGAHTLEAIHGLEADASGLRLSAACSSVDACSGGTASASEYVAGYGPEKAFDNVVSGGAAAGWLASSTPSANGRVGYQHVAPVCACAYAIQGFSDILGRNPTAWTFEGSNDGSAWDVLDTRSGVTWSALSEKKTFSVAQDKRAAYARHRLNITAHVSQTDNSLGVCELEILPCVYPTNTMYPALLSLDCTDWTALKALARTETLNSQYIWYALSFNGGTTYRAFVSGAWKPIVQNNAGTWQYWTGSAWAAATINSALGAMVQAIGVAGNRMTGATMAGLSQAQIEGSGGFVPGQTSLPVLVALYSASSTDTPALSELKVSTDPSVPSMPIGAAFGSGDGSTTFNLPNLTPPTGCMYVIAYE